MVGFVKKLLQSPRRGVICFLLALCALVVCSGVTRLGFDNDPRVYFSKDNPDLVAFEDFEETYKRDDTIFFVVQSKSGSIFKIENLRAIWELTDKAWGMENAERVDSLVNFMQVSTVGEDLRIEELLLEPELLSQEKLSDIKSYATNHPSIIGRLVSTDSATTLLKVTMLEPEGGEQVLRCYKEADVLAKMMEKKYPDLKIGITGTYAIANTFHMAGVKDATSLFPLMFGVMFLITWMILRSLMATVIVNIVLVLSSVTALGVFGWLGFPLNSTTASAPIVILVIAVADSIHMFRGVQRYAGQGSSLYDAVVLSLEKNFLPIFVTSLTTIFGFLSLGFSEVPPFRELGYLSAIGVAAAFLYSVVLLPLLTVCFGVKLSNHKEFKWIAGLLNFSTSLSRSYFRQVTLVTLVITALALYGISGLRIGDKNSDFFGMEFPFRQAVEMQEKAFKAGHEIEFSLDAREESGVFSPAFLEDMERFQSMLATHSIVSHTESIVTVLKELRMNMNGGDPASYALPASSEEAAQLMLLYETSLPQGRDLNLQLSSDRSKTRVSVVVDNVYTDELISLIGHSEKWFLVEAKHARLDASTGQSVLWSKLYERNTVAMLRSILVALLSITITLIIVMRSFRLGLLSLIPNISPIIFTFGVWCLLYDKIGIIASAVVAMMLGIIVDDTVHLLVQYKNALQKGEADPVSVAIFKVGDSIITTSIILASGFFCLGFSGFQLNAHTGILSATTVISALVLDLLFLPSILYWFANFQEKST